MSLAVVKVICYSCGNADSCPSLEDKLGLSDPASREQIAAGLERKALFHTCSLCGTLFRIIEADLAPRPPAL